MSDEPRVLGTREGYDLWATTYDTMGNWLLALEEPEVDRALGLVAGSDLLDAGAGTGRHAIRLAAQEARVTAIDLVDRPQLGVSAIRSRPCSTVSRTRRRLMRLRSSSAGV